MTLHVVELPFRAISKRPERARFVKLLFTNWVSTWLRNRIKYVPRSPSETTAETSTSASSPAATGSSSSD